MNFYYLIGNFILPAAGSVGVNASAWLYEGRLRGLLEVAQAAFVPSAERLSATVRAASPII